MVAVQRQPRMVILTVLRTDGTTEEIRQPEPPTLEQLQKLVGGYIERVQVDDRRILIVDEEGLLKGLPVNRWAAGLEDPLHVVGDAVLMMDRDFQ